MESMSADEYLERRLEDQIGWYDRKAAANQRWFKRLRLAELLLASSLPFWALVIGGDSLVRIVASALGVLIAILTGLITLYKFEENWIGYRSTCENLKREKFLFLTGAPPYHRADSFKLLVERVEGILGREHSQWTEYIRSDKGDESQQPVAGVQVAPRQGPAG